MPKGSLELIGMGFVHCGTRHRACMGFMTAGIICGSKKDSKKGKKKKQEVTSTSSAAVTANAPS